MDQLTMILGGFFGVGSVFSEGSAGGNPDIAMIGAAATIAAFFAACVWRIHHPKRDPNVRRDGFLEKELS